MNAAAPGRETIMTMEREQGNRGRTAATMRTTAAELEEAEATMHRSADAMPDRATKDRLHRLADETTRTATDIAGRADRMTPEAG